MKILRVFMAICILLTVFVTANAETSDILVEVFDVENNMISVSGTAPNDTFVTVLVLNPGYTLENVDLSGTTSDSDVIQYFGFAKSKNGKFEKKIEINTENGGMFTAIASVGNTLYSKEFQFYSYEVKSEYVLGIKGFTSVETAKTKLPEILSTYSLDTHPLYSEAQVDKIAKLVCTMNKSAKIQNPKEAEEFLLQVLLVNAYNCDNEKAFENGKIAYPEVLKITDNPWYGEYTSSISEKGYQAIKSGLFAGEYTSLADIAEKFESLLKYHAIMNNSQYGGDHVEYYINTYENEYKSLGFDIEAYKNSDKKKAIFLELLQSDATDINTLKEAFNKLFAKDDEGETLPPAKVPTYGGGGGGGGAKPTPTPEVTPEPTISPEPTVTPSSAYPFKDMDTASWAKDAVEALYEKKIVNGRSEDEFVPNATVTRAEFVKLVVEALEISETGGGKFADVSDNDWFAPFVARAYAAEIITGSNGMFAPNGEITREDAAVIIARAMKLNLNGECSFADKNSISDYAMGAVAALYEKGIINGVGDNMYAPKTVLTRAQAAVLIYNVLGGAVK